MGDDLVPGPPSWRSKLEFKDSTRPVRSSLSSAMVCLIVLLHDEAVVSVWGGGSLLCVGGTREVEWGRACEAVRTIVRAEGRRVEVANRREDIVVVVLFQLV